jgi:lipopolysaccharide transport system ATP-binding protein
VHPPFAIKVEGVSKRYELGSQQAFLAITGRTLRDALVDTIGRLNPFARSDDRLNGGTNGRRDLWALKDVDFEVQPGEVVGIVGRNGAGKSTLLKILSRITEPTEGRVEIFGRIGSLLEVGTGFHPELSGRENIYLNGSILGMSRREIAGKFDEIVAFAEVDQFIDTPVKRYSSGMYVRLAFAVAAHLEPDILIVDEVLAVGDAAFQQKCLGKMNDVAREGRTVIFVSHNTAVMLNLCRRGVLLERGRMTAAGAIQDVITKYLASLKAHTSWDLATTPEREGRGRVKFTRALFLDGDGVPVEHGVSGEPLVVALDYRSVTDRPLPNCRISVALRDQLGQNLFLCSSELTRREPITLPPEGSVRCRIPRLPLSQNQYVASVFLQVNGEVEDYIHSAVELEVVDGDFYGSGRLYPDSWRGIGVLVPHEWVVPSAIDALK